MKNKIADIEVLRGISIAFVVLHHFKNVLIGNHSRTLNTVFEFFDFWTGVDIFFGISGFVVARGLLPQLLGQPFSRERGVDVASFWVRRAWRLLPSAWLWLGLVLVAAFLFNQSGQFGTIKANVEATVVAMLQVANFRFADSLSGGFEYGASSVYWSLSQEEQFYFLLPIMILLLRERLAACLMVIIAIKAVLAVLIPGLQSYALLMLLRSDAMFLGVLLAIWSMTPSYRLFEPTALRSWYVRWGSVGLLLFCIAALACDRLHIAPSPLRFIIIGVVAVIPVFVASYDKNYLCAPGIIQKLGLWAGSRSYGIYLIHVPAFLLTKEIWFRLSPEGTVFDGAFNLRYTFTALLLTIGLSEVSYRLLEIPFRRRGKVVAERFKSSSTPPIPLNN